MLNNHLAIADQLFSRRSFAEHVLTRLLCNSTKIAPEHKSLVRAAAPTVIECGAAFLVTGNRRMGEIAATNCCTDELGHGPAGGHAGDAVRRTCVIDREQGLVCWKACKRLMSRMMQARTSEA